MKSTEGYDTVEYKGERLTPDQLADRIGVARRTIADWVLHHDAPRFGTHRQPYFVWEVFWAWYQMFCKLQVATGRVRRWP